MADAQGKGDGTELLWAVCDYAFTRGGLCHLTASITEGNQASRHVLEKVGVVLEGTLRESDWLLELLKQEYITTAGSPVVI